MPYYVYVLSSPAQVLYIGITNSLDRRIGEHRESIASSFSARYKLKKLVYYEEYSGIEDAIAREKQLKGWLRSKKIALIESVNPEWRDLTEE
jgi:putative endonuclease